MDSADYCCLACSIGAGVACVETERRIRADARRFLLAELEALTVDLANSNTRQKALERLRSLVESQPPLETVGEPSADSQRPQAGSVAHLWRENEQLRRRNEVLQAEVRRLRAQRSAA